MVSKHAKSPCCSSRIRRYGGRRRQCLACKKTWTIRPRRRGRRRKRLPPETLLKVLKHGYSLTHFARRRPHRVASTFRHHFRRLLWSYVSRPRKVVLPSGPLILLLDGLWFRFGNNPWVLYQVGLKPCAGKAVVFLDPTLLPGRESLSKWEAVVAKIPANFQRRIVGIVVDDLQGMRQLAYRRDWVLQLCQFHLTLKLYGRRGMLLHAQVGGPPRRELKALLRKALSLPAGVELDAVMLRVAELANEPLLAPRIRAVARELCHSLDHYRAYLRHPELGLPHTTNVVESMGARIRGGLHRHKAATNPGSLIIWATALTRASPNISCKPDLSTE